MITINNLAHSTIYIREHHLSSVQSLCYGWISATWWTVAYQTCLLKLISIKSVMPSNHLSLCCPLRLPNLSQNQGFFQNSHVLPSGGQRIGSSASASVLPMNIQDWFPSGLTGLISLQSKGLSRVFSNTTVQKQQCFRTQLSLWSIAQLDLMVNLSSGLGFLGGSEGKASPRDEGDQGLILWSGRSPGEGKGNAMQYSFLENSMDGGAW